MAAGTKDKAYQRLFTLFGMPGKVDTPEMRESIGKFGLGNKRSLEQYQEFIGVNLTTLEVIFACAFLALGLLVCSFVFRG